jgi:hypothetical protein
MALPLKRFRDVQPSTRESRLFTAGLALWFLLGPTVLGVLAGRAIDASRGGHWFVWGFGAIGMLWGWTIATRTVLGPRT